MLGVVSVLQFYIYLREGWSSRYVWRILVVPPLTLMFVGAVFLLISPIVRDHLAKAICRAPRESFEYSFQWACLCSLSVAPLRKREEVEAAAVATVAASVAGDMMARVERSALASPRRAPPAAPEKEMW